MAGLFNAVDKIGLLPAKLLEEMTKKGAGEYSSAFFCLKGKFSSLRTLA